MFIKPSKFPARALAAMHIGTAGARLLSWCCPDILAL